MKRWPCVIGALSLAACGEARTATPREEPDLGGMSGAGGLPGTGGASGTSTGGASVAGAAPTGGGGLGSAGSAGTTHSSGGVGGALTGGNGGGPIGGKGGTSGTTSGSSGTSFGGAGSGGTSGFGGGAASGMGGSGGTDPSGAFTLVFRDDFDTLDLARWQLMTHSWDGNLALFSASAAQVQGGQLVLRLTPAPSGTVDSGGAPKSFFGAEVRSRETLTYGRVRTRARLARGSAAVSALVTIYTPWPASNWNELDIECLGKDPANVQFNAMVYTGPPVTPPVTTSVTPTQFPQIVGLGFDPSADFHVYTIEWTPSGVRFLVDEQLRHTWSTRIELMGLPQNTLLTIWASSSAAWAGPVRAETGQAVAAYDWVELYRYAAR